MSKEQESLIKAVIEQIQTDVAVKYMIALQQLLSKVNEDDLMVYLLAEDTSQ